MEQTSQDQISKKSKTQPNPNPSLFIAKPNSQPREIEAIVGHRIITGERNTTYTVRWKGQPAIPDSEETVDTFWVIPQRKRVWTQYLSDNFPPAQAKSMRIFAGGFSQKKKVNRVIVTPTSEDSKAENPGKNENPDQSPKPQNPI